MAEKLEQNGFNIPMAVITRWNSQFHTIARTIEIPSDKLNGDLSELKKDSLILSQRDVAILQEFITVFALFAEIFTRAQADQTASISLVAPSVLEIYYDLESEQASSKYAGGLCKALLNSMGNRFNGLFKQFGLSIEPTGQLHSTAELYSDPIFLMAPFLDARFGLRWIMHSKLPSETRVQLIKTVKRLVLNAAFQLHGSSHQEQIETTADTLSGATVNSSSPGLKRKTLFAFPKDNESLVKRIRPNRLNKSKKNYFCSLEKHPLILI